MKKNKRQTGDREAYGFINSLLKGDSAKAKERLEKILKKKVAMRIKDTLG